MDTYILYHILGICFLLSCSCFFSASETALFSLPPFRVTRLRDERGRRGKLIARLLGNPRRLLISILIGNMFVNIFSSAIAESLIRSFVPGGRGTLLAILVMTFAILVFGEITPKTIAIQYAERVSLAVAPLIDIIGRALFPIRKVVRLISDALIFLFSRRISPSEHAITEAEIKTAIAVGHREGVVDSQEKEMIHGVFGFADKTVEEIMRPRNEMVAFDALRPVDEIEETIREKELSRIPIYEGEFDNIVGILYAKDLLRHDGDGDTSNVTLILRPAYFVPEMKTASSLFREFRRRKIHMAIVVDEYGGVSGLITLEDLLEEIIGEIRDKGDTSPLHRETFPGTFVVKAKMDIASFNEAVGAAIEDETSVTIGGFLLNRIGSIPPKGYRFRHGNIVFTVSKAKRNRIEEIIVSKATT